MKKNFHKKISFSLIVLLFATLFVSCAGNAINSPLSRAEKRIYRLDTMVVEAMESLPNKTIKRDVELELGDGWRYWLFGYRPLEVIIQIHDLSVPSSQLQRAFGSESRMTSRIIIKDIQSGSVLDDFTWVTRGGYEGLSFSGGGQEAQESAQKILAELFVEEFRVMFYFGQD